MESVKHEQALDISWRAFELNPREAQVDEEARAAKHAQIKAGFGRLQALAREQYGVEIEQGPLGIDTRTAHRGAKVATAMDVGAAYHDRVFKAYWQECRDISQTEVLAQIAEEIGLARDPFVEALDLSETLNAVLQDARQARQYGLTGVPATILVGRYLLSGAMPVDELRETFEQLRAHGAHEEQ